MFIWTVSCFRLMAKTTSVSHGDPCWPADFPFFPKEGVDVLVTESAGERTEVRREPWDGSGRTCVRSYPSWEPRNRKRCGCGRAPATSGSPARRGTCWCRPNGPRRRWATGGRAASPCCRPTSSSRLSGWTRGTGAASRCRWSPAWRDRRLRRGETKPVRRWSSWPQHRQQEEGSRGRSPGRLMVWSPKNRRLAMLRRYQARGKARISLSRLMSYLKDADPMSQTAAEEKSCLADVTFSKTQQGID